MEIDIKQLHPLEVRLLRAFKVGEVLSPDSAEERLGFNVGQYNQAVNWLVAKSLAREKSRRTKTIYELTELGCVFASEGIPEKRIIEFVEERGPHSLSDICKALNLEQKDVGSAFGQLRKEGVLSMDDKNRVVLADVSATDRVEKLQFLVDKASASSNTLDADELSDEELSLIRQISKKRGAANAAFKIVEKEIVLHELTPLAEDVKKEIEKQGISGEELGTLTPELLKTGAWKGKSFRPYNVQIPPKRVIPGRSNPYCDYLAWVKDKMVGLGFEEFDGPLVETEFWNSDALFMPQFHAARDIHDVYYIKDPQHASELPEPYLTNVAETHKNGWETGSRGWDYDFDRDFTRRLILRSQGTVLSAKQLPKAKVPGKYFGIVRCFRHDQVDATHLSDFYQTEGIVVGEQVNFRNLLGLLKMFAEEVAGATEVKYVPGYFPFTEPSVEVHIKHPVLGWFELGGSGIFRPEVTKPLGIDVPVLAWGLGIDRMALMHLGLNDLRELFSYNIENVRMRRRSK
ncbi:phenylalanine--tRNA ligase subunit alpha [Spirochaetia bacterium 38H-sp]|uniref:Phenylalanine--tRNA ligase alpha subunit n=1 Tax=Rarispira pelagica TaxID=3141764 RepID=A0ABU9U8W7_9SPIR